MKIIQRIPLCAVAVPHIKYSEQPGALTENNPFYSTSGCNGLFLLFKQAARLTLYFQAPVFRQWKEGSPLLQRRGKNSGDHYNPDFILCLQDKEGGPRRLWVLEEMKRALSDRESALFLMCSWTTPWSFWRITPTPRWPI